MSDPQQIIGDLIKNIFKIKRQNMFQVSIPNQQVLNKIKIQINNKLAKYYKHPLIRNYLKSLPPKCLLDQGVVMFVGSRTRPQNVPLRNQLIQIAIQKAQKQETQIMQKLTNQQKHQLSSITKFNNNLNELNQQKNSHKNQNINQIEDDKNIVLPNSQKYLAKYYTHAFTKYEAMQKKEPQRWQSCAQTIIDLADKGHSLSSMMLAKDYYFRIDSQNLSPEKKSQLVIQAAQYFYHSVTEIKSYQKKYSLSKNNMRCPFCNSQTSFFFDYQLEPKRYFDSSGIKSKILKQNKSIINQLIKQKNDKDLQKQLENKEDMKKDDSTQMGLPSDRNQITINTIQILNPKNKQNMRYSNSQQQQSSAHILPQQRQLRQNPQLNDLSFIEQFQLRTVQDISELQARDI